MFVDGECGGALDATGGSGWRVSEGPRRPAGPEVSGRNPPSERCKRLARSAPSFLPVNSPKIINQTCRGGRQKILCFGLLKPFGVLGAPAEVVGLINPRAGI